MKICWDSLENLRYNKSTDRWYKGGNTYEYVEECLVCNDPFLRVVGRNRNIYCSCKCARTDKQPPTEDTKRKISCTIKKLFNNKKNHPMYGKKHSEESKMKMSVSASKRIRKPHSEETKRKISIGNLGNTNGVGEKNGSWKGGISFEPYCRTWKDKEFRNFIYERDENKDCWNPQCSGNSDKVCLHHIDYNKKNCVPENIIKLCNSCNVQANFNREWWEAFYKEIMRRRKGNEKCACC